MADCIPPKISVIMPVYNTAGYLREAIESICGQTLRELEILLIDDGSTDDSPAIIREYATRDARIQCYTQSNQGQGAARNHALQHATGEYIYFMDSDDKLEPTALQECYEACCRDKLDFVFFDAETFGETANRTYIPNYDRSRKIDNKVWQGAELLDYMLDKHLYSCSVCLCLVSRPYLEEAFNGFPTGIIHEDHWFGINIYLKARRAAYLPKAFFKRRVRPHSTMTNRFGMRNVEGYATVFSLMTPLKEQHPEWRTLIDKYLTKNLNAVIWTSHRLTFPEKVATFSRFRRLRFHRYVTFRNWLVFWFKPHRKH